MLKFPIKTPAFLIKQGKKRIFLTYLPGKILADEKKFQVDYWRPEDRKKKVQGYQRKAMGSHINKVATYLGKEGSMLPTAIVLNSRSKLSYKNKSGFIELNIDHPLWVVDGQHRIGGLRKALSQGLDEWKNRPLPTIILDDFEQIEEAEQFDILNRTQKGIKTDLVQRLKLLLVMNKKAETDWALRALTITDFLNDDDNSVWKDRIKLPNEEHPPKRKMVTQNTFINSLKNLLKEPGPLSIYKDIEVPSKCILNYWNALAKIFPNAFENPQLYVIHKTTGVYVFNDLATKIFQYDQDRTESSLFTVLKSVLDKSGREGKEEFWLSKNVEGASLYGNAKARKLLAQNFKNNVPEPKKAK